MFRGEPLALYTILTGFIAFIFVQFFGLLASGFIDNEFINSFSLVLQSHFILAHLGWLGMVIMGAQLQFYRAIGAIRKFGPNWLRFVFLFSLVLGIILIIFGNSIENSKFIFIGLLIYLLGTIIQFYWLTLGRKSKHFKFPLDYFYISQIIFITALIYITIISFNELRFLSKIDPIKHLFSIGWISLTLQGAIIRIFPMFLGLNIDRKLRKSLEFHTKYSIITTLGFLLTLYFDIQILILLIGVLWAASWIWTFIIIGTSIVPHRQRIENKETMLMMGFGLVWLTIGTSIGFYLQIWNNESSTINWRALHIHFSYLAGISQIMLGAMNRIHSFQIYTLLYTGRREVAPELKSLFRLRRYVFVSITYNLAILIMFWGFKENDYDLVGIGGVIIMLATFIYASILGQNLYLYLKEKDKAIPFWLKANEAEK